MNKSVQQKAPLKLHRYERLVSEIQQLLAEARRQAARSVNAILTATYWEFGRRIVEFELRGKGRAGYGEELMDRLSVDLRKRFGRGFGVSNVKMMRQFYLSYPNPEICQSLIGESGQSKKSQPVTGELLPGKFALAELVKAFPLSWTHYARLLRVQNDQARAFYEKDAAVARYALEGLPNKVLASEYRTTLPDEHQLAEELRRTRLALDARLAVGRLDRGKKS